MITFGMMRYFLLFIFLFSGFVSCNDAVKDDQTEVSAVEEPADLIPEDKMIKLITDVHLLESAVGLRSPAPRSRKPGLPGQEPVFVTSDPTQLKSIGYYDVFSGHGVTREQYLESYAWYSLDAEEFSLMYDEVINELIRLQAKEQAGSPKPVQPEGEKK